MGALFKPLAPIAGKPMVRYVFEAAVSSRVSRAVAVTGPHHEKITHTAGALNIETVHNPDYRDGLSTSLAAGVRAVADDTDGVIVLLGDMPLVDATVIDRLIAEFRNGTERTICVPTFLERRGNPVLWGAAYFDELMAVTGDKGGRQLLGRHADHVKECALDSDGILVDADDPEALEILRRRMNPK